MKFADEFDSLLAKQGPGSIFTMNHDQEFQFDLFRTRDWCRRFQIAKHPDLIRIDWTFAVVVDQLTLWPSLVLFTSNAMLQSDEHSKVFVCESFEKAQGLLLQKKDIFFQSNTQ